MRVQLVISLAAVAVITYAAEARPTTPVAESQTDSLKRSNSTASADDDERMFSLSTALEKVKSLLTSSSKEQEKAAERLKRQQEREKADEKAAERLKRQQERENVDNQLDEAYTRLKLADFDPKKKDDLVGNLNFFLWLEKADELAMKHPQTATSAVASLTKQLGPRRVAELIEAATKVSKTKSNAKKLEEAQMNYWLESGKSVHSVFELDNAGNDLPTFIFYVEKFNVAHPGEKVSAVEFLTKAVGDERLADLFKVAVEKTYLMTKNEVSELFTILGREWARDGLLINPIFKYWRTCLEKFNAAQPHGKPRISIFKSLTTAVDDKRLAEILQAELNVKSDEKFAKRLQAEQHASWLSAGKSLKDVFGFLGLDRADHTLLENDPSMIRFTKFAVDYNKNHKNDLSVINQAGTEEKLRQGINFALSTPSGADTTETEKALFQLWFTEYKHPAEIFEHYLTKVDEKDNLFESPLFAILLKYTDAYRTNFQSFGTDVVEMIEKYYALPSAVRMLLAAKEAPSPSARYAAQRVEDKMLYNWTFKEKPDAIFERLQLSKVKNPAELFKNPLFQFWMKYMDSFLKDSPAKTESRKCLATLFNSRALVKAIAEAYNNPDTKVIAEKVWTELLNQYLFVRKKPKNVPELLKPEASEEKELLKPEASEEKESLTNYKDAYVKNEAKIAEAKAEKKKQEATKKKQEAAKKKEEAAKKKEEAAKKKEEAARRKKEAKKEKEAARKEEEAAKKRQEAAT